MRLNVDNRRLPGVQTDRDPGSDPITEWVYKDDECIGSIVYVSRRTAAGILWGWRPYKAAPQSRLTTKVEAIERLPRVQEVGHGEQY